jgi:hypothetical protein
VSDFNAITLPRWQNYVRRRFGLVGPGGNVPVVAPEIQPTAVVEPAAFEHEAMRGIKHYQQGDTVAAAGNSWLWMQLLNPATSNVIAVVTGLDVTYANTGASHAGIAQIPSIGLRYAVANFSAGPVTAFSTDSRRSISRASCELYHQAAAAGVFAMTENLGYMTLHQTSSLNGFVAGALAMDFFTARHNYPVLLLPGYALAWAETAVGVNGDVYCVAQWRWYEQDLEIAEARIL